MRWLLKGVKKISFSLVFTYVKADLDLKLAANFCLSVLAERFCCWRFFFNPLKSFMKAVHFIIASHFSSAQTDKKISLAIYFKQYQTIYPPNTAITAYFEVHICFLQYAFLLKSPTLQVISSGFVLLSFFYVFRQFPTVTLPL